MLAARGRRKEVQARQTWLFRRERPDIARDPSLAGRKSVEGRKLPASYAGHSGVIALHFDVRPEERSLIRHHPRLLAANHHLVPYIALGGAGNRDLDDQIGLIGQLGFIKLSSRRGQLVEPFPREETRHLPDLPVAEPTPRIYLPADLTDGASTVTPRRSL